MDRRTLYLDLDRAAIARTHEGIEISAADDVVVLSGSRAAFDALTAEIAMWDPTDVQPAPAARHRPAFAAEAPRDHCPPRALGGPR